MSPKKPSTPREGDQYGFDPAAETRARMRALFDRDMDDRGGLAQIGAAAGVPKISPIKKRLIEASVDIRQDDPDELTYMHSVLTQCSLPAAKPKPETLVWSRLQGKAALMIEAGKVRNPRTREWQQMGLPYGPKARLLLMHLNSEAIKNQSPIIEVEETMTAFFRRLMGKTQDGRQAKMLKAQLSALAAAQFRLSFTVGDRAMQMDAKVVGAFELWFNRDESQRVLWPTTLRLSLDYFDSLTRYAVPLDERAVAALAHSALALDIYCWLAQRLHRVPQGRPQFIPWPALQEQFGQHYARIRDFRRDFLSLLKQVKTAYPDAKFDADGKGMQLWQSLPPVKKRLVSLPSPNLIDLKAEEI